jgi:hypothetical protein
VVIKSKGATARPWLLKERFQHFWTYRSVDWAPGFLDARITGAMRCRLDPMKKAAGMLRSHRELTGNYFGAKNLYNSGVVEVLNLKCSLVKRRPGGLRTFSALQVALYQIFLERFLNPRLPTDSADETNFLAHFSRSAGTGRYRTRTSRASGF